MRAKTTPAGEFAQRLGRRPAVVDGRTATCPLVHGGRPT
ncbi:hypothetical protein J3R08_002537 [Micromonospora sp. HB375]|nr:hypothetical protein [Micromonospora sp. HB375]MDH6472065.1 hypothetical protein [Micromonospora sp. H404/HB375]